MTNKESLFLLRNKIRDLQKSCFVENSIELGGACHELPRTPLPHAYLYISPQL